MTLHPGERASLTAKWNSWRSRCGTRTVDDDAGDGHCMVKRGSPRRRDFSILFSLLPPSLRRIASAASCFSIANLYPLGSDFVLLSSSILPFPSPLFPFHPFSTCLRSDDVETTKPKSGMQRGHGNIKDHIRQIESADR